MMNLMLVYMQIMNQKTRAPRISHHAKQILKRKDNAKDRLNIIHNVLEEHGDMDEDEFHATNF